MDPAERERLLATGDYDYPEQTSFRGPHADEIDTLRAQLYKLEEAHNNLKRHYHEFVRATVQLLKDSEK